MRTRHPRYECCLPPTVVLPSVGASLQRHRGVQPRTVLPATANMLMSELLVAARAGQVVYLTGPGDDDAPAAAVVPLEVARAGLARAGSNRYRRRRQRGSNIVDELVSAADRLHEGYFERCAVLVSGDSGDIENRLIVIEVKRGDFFRGGHPRCGVIALDQLVSGVFHSCVHTPGPVSGVGLASCGASSAMLGANHVEASCNGASSAPMLRERTSSSVPASTLSSPATLTGDVRRSIVVSTCGRRPASSRSP